MNKGRVSDMAAQLAPAVSSSLMTRVAIVEDNATLRQYLAELINSTPGHSCVCSCPTAEVALKEIPKIKPDVVLMDIHLPGESGIACTARLRETMPNLQVIMLTVYKDIKMIFQALKVGACGYVLKRSDETEILAAIAEVRAGGAPMTSEIARRVIESFHRKARSPEKVVGLSAREEEILVLLAKGYSNKLIADQIGLSYDTVSSHLKRVYQKLHVNSRTEAVIRYLAAHGKTPSEKPPL